MAKPEVQTQEETPKLGFWGKTKLAVKEFFNSAITGLPKTIAYSAIALGGSAALGHFTGFNPLQVHGFDKDLVLRGIGAVGLGSIATGVIGSYQAVANADNPQPASTPVPPRNGQVQEQEPSQSYSPSMTPMGKPQQPQRASR